MKTLNIILLLIVVLLLGGCRLYEIETPPPHPISGTVNVNITDAPAGDTCSCSSIQLGNPVDCSEACDIGECNAPTIDLSLNGIGPINLIGTLTLDSLSVDNQCTFNNEIGDGNKLIIKNG